MTNNLTRRIHQHQSGYVKSTKSRIPFEIIYTKEFTSRESAREYEKYLKTSAGKKYLRAILGLQQPSSKMSNERFVRVADILRISRRLGFRLVRDSNNGTAERSEAG